MPNVDVAECCVLISTRGLMFKGEVSDFAGFQCKNNIFLTHGATLLLGCKHSVVTVVRRSSLKSLKYNSFTVAVHQVLKQNLLSHT